VRATLKAGEIHTVPSTQRVVPRRKSLLLPHTVLPIGLLQRPGQIIILIKRPSTNKGWRPIRRSTCCCVKYLTHGRSMLCDKRLPLPQTGISQCRVVTWTGRATLVPSAVRGLLPRHVDCATERVRLPRDRPKDGLPEFPFSPACSI
jgi:hypothetical protein